MRVILIFVVLLTSAWGYDAQLEGPGLSIELISESRSVTAGEPFTLGLHIHHSPGFHTYWKNPGLVGLATSIDWTLPEGFTASAISWPYPQKSFMAEYPCHGYERDVTLLVTITPPEKISESTVTLSAKTIWMCCAKGCFPGFQTFTIALPVSNTSKKDPTASALIQRARTELPKTDHDIKANLLSAPDAKLIKVRFQGLKKQDLTNFYFFSSDHQISSDQKQTLANNSDGSVTLTVPRSEFSPKGISTLAGVLKVGSQHLVIEAKPVN